MTELAQDNDLRIVLFNQFFFLFLLPSDYLKSGKVGKKIIENELYAAMANKRKGQNRQAISENYMYLNLDLNIKIRWLEHNV